jgi:hypothetical protein
MKLIAIDSQNVILTNMNMYRSQLSMSCVYRSIVLQMEMLIVWEELMKENTVAENLQSASEIHTHVAIIQYATALGASVHIPAY